MEAIGHRETVSWPLGSRLLPLPQTETERESRARWRNRGSRWRQRNSASTEAAAVSTQTAVVPLLLAALGSGASRPGQPSGRGVRWEEARRQSRSQRWRLQSRRRGRQTSRPGKRAAMVDGLRVLCSCAADVACLPVALMLACNFPAHGWKSAWRGLACSGSMRRPWLFIAEVRRWRLRRYLPAPVAVRQRRPTSMTVHASCQIDVVSTRIAGN